MEQDERGLCDSFKKKKQKKKGTREHDDDARWMQIFFRIKWKREVARDFLPSTPRHYSDERERDTTTLSLKWRTPEEEEED